VGSTAASTEQEPGWKLEYNTATGKLEIPLLLLSWNYKPMRLFTGISLPHEVTYHLTRQLDHLRPTAHLKWTPVYNLHITTKFIGAWPEERLEEIKGALQKVRTSEPIPISVNGLGWFPNPHHPHTLVITVRAPETLIQLAEATDKALQGLGVSPEPRPFSPHITLARIKEANPLIELKRAIAALPTVDFGTFAARSFQLFESSPGPAGSVYTHLADFPFAQR
jgi:2'-5' RNA ligase